MVYLSAFVVFQRETILDTLNAFSYYRLPAKQQAVYCHLLNRVQNGDAIKMGPFAELNCKFFTFSVIELQLLKLNLTIFISSIKR